MALVASLRSTPFRLLVAVALSGTTVASAASERLVPLPGHVPAALARADVVTSPDATTADAAPLIVTFVLRHDDQAGFDRYLRDLSDPTSPHFHRYLTQAQIADRFGPSRRTTTRLERYLRAHGLDVTSTAKNRLTLTAQGSRPAVERALHVAIGTYRLGTRTVFANDRDPALPADLAPHVAAVTGLSDLAHPAPSRKSLRYGFLKLYCTLLAAPIPPPPGNHFCNFDAYKPYRDCLAAAKAAAESDTEFFWDFTKYDTLTYFNICPDGGFGPTPAPAPATAARAAGRALAGNGASGVGQKIAIVGFDSFERTDVEDYLALMGMPASQIDQLSQVHVAGGAALGSGQDEVLLDITTVMTLARGANVVVYDAPFGTGSFQALFNAAVDGGATVITNSWAYCEDQTTLADVQSLDTIFANAAMSGISVFNASGDTGATCLDGAANTVAVPASAPHATAVGGSTVTPGDGKPVKQETWWDGSASVPPTGQGGFGVSRFFDRPAYQNGFNSDAKRSVPDLVLNADPANGVVICQASAGGCPSGSLYGGTSLTAPTMAGIVAVMNETLGHNLGAVNDAFYPLAGAPAFNDAAALGSDFAHVGLGSPNVPHILARLANQTIGLPDAAGSLVSPLLALDAVATLELPLDVPADGSTKAYVRVTLLDTHRYPVAGKTVALTTTAAHAVIAPANGVTDVHGSVVFTITDDTAEDVPLTATDTTDGIELDHQPTIPFVVPPAAAASIQAFPTSVTANGIATTTITVTLHDGLGRPAPGKAVTLSQGTGHSLITAPNPSVTDNAGQIQFTATDTATETVTYTAVDVTDDELDVPGTAVVSFINGAGNTCGDNDTPPSGVNGYQISSFVTGFQAAPLSYSNINFGGCSGVGGIAFGTENIFVPSFLTGDFYKLDKAGGAATNVNKLSTLGPTLNSPIFGRDGKLYALREATGGNFTTGIVVELDQTTGQIVRTLASNLTCPGSLVSDPLSGDLFLGLQCFGAGADDGRILRVRNPGSATPTVETYVTLSTTPTGQLSFTPNGSLYVVQGYTAAHPQVVRISGTNGPATPTVTPLDGVTSHFWVNIASVGADGEATALLLVPDADLAIVDITANPPTSTSIATGGSIGGGIIGPDGCLYSSIKSTVYRLTDAAGGCSFLTGTASPTIALTPGAVTPDPAQGTALTFTANLRNVAAPGDARIVFQVRGANPQIKLVRPDATGKATFTYTGTLTGKDVVIATANIGDTPVTSNRARITWVAGPHVTALSLNQSPTSGTPGVGVAVAVSAVDLSVDPAAPLAGAPIDVTVGAAGCSGTTDANGRATCTITPATLGALDLHASYAGSADHRAADASVRFDVLCPSGLDGVTCQLGVFTNTLDAAAATDVKKPVRKAFLKKAQRLGKLAAKAATPGKKGLRATKQLRRGLDALGRQLQHVKSKKMATALRDALLANATAARAAVPQ